MRVTAHPRPWHRLSEPALRHLAGRAHLDRIRLFWDGDDIDDGQPPDGDDVGDDVATSPPKACTVQGVDARQLLHAGCVGHGSMDRGRPLLTASVEAVLTAGRLEVIDAWLSMLSKEQISSAPVLRVLSDFRAGREVTRHREELLEAVELRDRPGSCLASAALVGAMLDECELREHLEETEGEVASADSEPAAWCRVARLYAVLLRDDRVADLCLEAARGRAAAYTSVTLVDVACGVWDCFGDRDRALELLATAEQGSRVAFRSLRRRTSIIASAAWSEAARARWLLLGQDTEAERCLREAERCVGGNAPLLLDLASRWMLLFGDRAQASRLIAQAGARGGSDAADEVARYRKHVLGMG